ncbi:MAG: dihydroorotase, partial [Gammaproteobacteria bacterium]|nr:dihydroorotase [Gammaproteobacteria bacterium]
MKALVIKDARIVNEGRTTEGDVLIIGGRIEQVGRGLSVPDGASVLDAGGKLLLPGFIDDQVHFREPGLTRKGDIYTESTAAVSGGITSYME